MEEKKELEKILERVFDKMDRVADRQEKTAEISEKIVERQEKMMERQEKMAERQEKVVEIQEKMMERQEKVVEIQEKMMERQEKVVGIQEKMAERQEKMAERQEKMMERQEKMVEMQDKVAEDRKKWEEKHERWAEEAKKRQEENDVWLKEFKADNKRASDELRATVSGIGKSNGMYSEDYFFRAVNDTKTFGGIHFDEVLPSVHSIIKLEDGKRLEGQYDIVMYNDDAVCIIEIKYRLRPEDVLEVADKDVQTFKKLFPMYATGYKFYLAVGGMAVEDEALKTAKSLGIGVIKAKSGVVEIFDENLKAY